MSQWLLQEIWVLAAGDAKPGPGRVNNLTEMRKAFKSFLAGNLEIFSPASLRSHPLEGEASSQKWQVPYHYLGPGWEYKCFWVQTHSRSTRKQSSPWQIRTSTAVVSSKLAHDLIPAAHTDHPRVNTFSIFQVGIGPCLLRTGAYQDASKVSSSIPCCNIGLKRSVRGNGTFAAGQRKNKNPSFTKWHCTTAKHRAKWARSSFITSNVVWVQYAQ